MVVHGDFLNEFVAGAVDSSLAFGWAEISCRARGKKPHDNFNLMIRKWLMLCWEKDETFDGFCTLPLWRVLCKLN
jgi:hypothetical protein